MSAICSIIQSQSRINLGESPTGIKVTDTTGQRIEHRAFVFALLSKFGQVEGPVMAASPRGIVQGAIDIAMANAARYP